MMSDFNKILRQQCNIELQTNCKISVKCVDSCNSCSGFRASTQKMKCPTQAMPLLNCVAKEISNNIGLPKVLLEMSSACSNAGLKMLTPLFDRFVNDRLLELFPLFNQA